MTLTDCPGCGEAGGPDRIRCERCGELVEVRLAAPPPSAELRARFESRRGARAAIDRSGVWRFRELVAPSIAEEHVVTIPEGRTPLFESRRLAEWCGLLRPLLLKHEGMNPTGSFKDRGMTVGASVARARRARALACASTGNTSASLAAYAARGGMRAIVFIPEGKIAHGKLAQTLAYGARVVEVAGSFDRAMELVERAAEELGLYLLNSVNPWRIEGQKAIVFELLDDLDWRPPDWIALPAGNLGNTSALGKALREAIAAGLIARAPRLLSVQAAGAAPFLRLWKEGAASLLAEPRPETVATAIRIGNPRSWRKALRAIRETGGAVEAASDEEILEAKARIDADGIGCEPASAASVAGVRKAVLAGAIARDAEVACVLTGHVLKDPETTVEYHTEGAGPCANRPVKAPGDLARLREILRAETEAAPRECRF
jgi:threonine synthase